MAAGALAALAIETPVVRTSIERSDDTGPQAYLECRVMGQNL